MLQYLPKISVEAVNVLIFFIVFPTRLKSRNLKIQRVKQGQSQQ